MRFELSRVVAATHPTPSRSSDPVSRKFHNGTSSTVHHDHAAAQPITAHALFIMTTQLKAHLNGWTYAAVRRTVRREHEERRQR
jgi:hypothetical protein